MTNPINPTNPTNPVGRRSASSAAVPVLIELFALDTEHCAPCRSAVGDMFRAAAELTRQLDGSSYAVATRVVHLASAEEARRLAVVSSPTVRVNGRDVAWAVQEQRCPSCSELAKTPVECRTYLWQGQWYDHPPVPLIVAAVRRYLNTDDGDHHHGSGDRPSQPVNTSIDRFFAAPAAQR